ncbi:MAG: hypothetical protein IPM06_20915 [Rhizobiales bacterium]|nr:hypothetical protein [Hyphomicrobiales bacterium]
MTDDWRKLPRKAGGGRKPTAPGGVHPVTITLSDADVALLKRIDSNISNAVRVLIQEKNQMLHQNDVLMEVAIDRILQWDYKATGDLAPWDYDAGLTGATGREDAVAFVVEYDWKAPAKDDPKGFEIAFDAWRNDVIERQSK